MRKDISLFLLIILAFLICAGCRGGVKAIQIKGSDTMVNLSQGWAEKFMEKNPDISIAVTGGGSGTGIAALISNTTDIAECSRGMEEKEINLAKKNNISPKEIHVANDGIAIVVHSSNPVSKLSVKQLSDIYTCKIKNWKDVGGPNKNIVVLSRDRNSGTHIFFLENVVKLGDKKCKNEFAPETLMMPSNQAIVEEVSINKAAIGYIGLGYLTEKQKALLISKDDNSKGVLPTVEAVAKGIYPISRALYFYTNGEPSGQIKSFIDYVLSAEGQKVVLDMGFVPLK